MFSDIPANWVRRETDQDEIHVMPPVGGKSTENDHSETYSVDEDDSNARDDDADDDGEGEDVYSLDEESEQPRSYDSRQLDDESATSSAFTPSQTVVTEKGIVPYDEKQSKRRK